MTRSEVVATFTREVGTVLWDDSQHNCELHWKDVANFFVIEVSEQ